MTTLIPGFRTADFDHGDVRIHYAIGGSGPPLLLIHGYPQTHAMWRKVAPALAKRFTVIVPDLRGYGDSSKPAGDERHETYSKRAMAGDMAALMTQLGFAQFAVCGHDRGARVTHRLCLDHPDRVTRAAVLDIVPTRYVYEHTDMMLGTYYFHWFFLIQPAPFPEKLIAASADFFVGACFKGWSKTDPTQSFGEAFAEYRRCFVDPATIHATCEDYRAGASIDLEHDRADASSRVRCPLLVLWGKEGFVGKRYDVLDVWRQYAQGTVEGHAVTGGHFLPEEAPDETLAALEAFL
jgi:haloacetate dehalogenase